MASLSRALHLAATCPRWRLAPRLGLQALASTVNPPAEKNVPYQRTLKEEAVGPLAETRGPSQPLPNTASVVVIGGGSLGCQTLYHLAKLGVTGAVLLERERLTSGTTWHTAGRTGMHMGTGRVHGGTHRMQAGHVGGQPQTWERQLSWKGETTGQSGDGQMWRRGWPPSPWRAATGRGMVLPECSTRAEAPVLCPIREAPSQESHPCKGHLLGTLPPPPGHMSSTSSMCVHQQLMSAL